MASLKFRLRREVDSFGMRTISSRSVALQSSKVEVIDRITRRAATVIDVSRMIVSLHNKRWKRGR